MSLNKETDKENLLSVSINEKNNMIKKIVQDLPKQKKIKLKIIYFFSKILKIVNSS